MSQLERVMKSKQAKKSGISIKRNSTATKSKKKAISKPV